MLVLPVLRRLLSAAARAFMPAAIDVHYRPELHYMRGPGPKWHEKRGLPYAPSPRRPRPRPLDERLAGI